MKNIRIMQIIPSLNSGGIERGTVDLALFLKSQKIESGVVSTGGYLESELEKATVGHVKFQSKSKNPLTFYQRVNALRKILKSEQPGILHARSRIPAWLAYFANKSVNLPFVTTCHGLHDNGFLGLKRLYNASVTKGDCVIAVSEVIKEYLINNFPGIKNKIVVIHRGIDCTYFTPQKNRNIKFCIVLPGRITRLKGHLYFLKSFAYVKEKYAIDAKILIVGKAKSTRYLKKLYKLVRELGIEKSVQFIEQSDDMASIYAQADLVISSSIEPESFCRVAV